jgi:hypothetical protein
MKTSWALGDSEPSFGPRQGYDGPIPLIGYARDSTDDQVTDAQTDVLTTAGCAVIFRE